MARTNKSVPLGSGRAYISEFTGTSMPNAEAIKALCIDANLAGESKGGATLTYTETKHREQDDHGRVMRVITTEEECKMKLGLFSWAPEILKKLSSTCRSVTDGNYTVYKLGGLSQDDGKRYIVVFKQIDPELGDMFFAMIGTNSAGITLAFARDNTTKLEPEFLAQPSDSEGTLLTFFEDVATTSAAGGGGEGH